MIERALVTGHKGFVGTAIFSALKHGRWGTYRVDGCDITDGSFADCRLLFADNMETPYDLVVHCAAVVGGRLMISNDPLAVAVDLAIDSDLFRWAARGNAKRIVYFSSSAAYPTALQVPEHRLREDEIEPLSEGHAVGVPDLTYGWAKLTGEMLVQYARQAGVIVHVLRPFSGYGETQEPSYPFPAFVARAKRRADPFDIWGDGSQARDFIHLDDILATAHRMIELDHPGPLNVGTGRATNFTQLATMITSAVGYHPKFRYVDNPTGPDWRVADVNAMNKIHTAKITLEEGIARALAHG